MQPSQAALKKKNERRIKAKESMEQNELLLKTGEEERRRKELELTRKCEEEVAKRNEISAARAELEIKHFEEKQGKVPSFTGHIRHRFFPKNLT